MKKIVSASTIEVLNFNIEIIDIYPYDNKVYAKVRGKYGL